jgi:O-antigen/teichoic acid export membrane protein
VLVYSDNHRVTNVGLMLLRKDIQFSNVVLHQTLSDVIMTGIAIAVAFATHNVWALVVSQVAGAVISVALSYKLHPFRPAFLIDRQVLKDCASFSAHLFAVGVFTYITTQFDNIVVARHLGIAIAGAYMLAYRLANLPADIVSEVFSPVLFPAYSEIRHSRGSELSSKFELAFVTTMAAIFAATIPFNLAADWMIHLVYGKKWESAIPMLSILVAVGILRGLARVLGPLFLATERPSVESTAKAMEGVLFIGLVLVLVPRYGTWGAATAGIASYALAFSLRFALALRLFRERAGSICREAAAVVISTMAAYALAYTLKHNDVHPILYILAFELALAVLIMATLPRIRDKIIYTFRGYSPAVRLAMGRRA